MSYGYDLPGAAWSSVSLIKSEPKPWIGFAIRKAPGRKNNLLVADVVDDGPADEAGIINGDQIASFDGRPVPDVNAYRRLLKSCRPGQTVQLKVVRVDRRNNEVTKLIPVQIGELKKPDVKNPPPFRNLEDVRAILNDRIKLEKFNTVMFSECDEDMSGLVTQEEFISTIGPWLKRFLGIKLDRAKLEDIFDFFDADNSGFLRKSEFLSLTEGFLELILEGPDDRRSSDSDHNRNGGPKPWIGFAIRNANCRKNSLLVVDVADDGPAAKAGLRHGDEIVSVDYDPVPDVAAYQRMLKGRRPGQTVVLVVLRDGQGKGGAVRMHILVQIGELKKPDVKNPPPFRNLEDVRAILNDRTKLEKFNTVMFSECDGDMSGLVTKKEFVSTIGPWLTRFLDIKLDRAQLEDIFDFCDADHSGFLRKSEFTPVTRDLLKTVLERIVDVPQVRNQQVVVEKIVEVEVPVVVEKIVEVLKIVDNIIEVERIVDNIIEVEKIVEVEVPVTVEVEKIVEVPVERIVERIVEVPQIITREVPVERIVEKIVTVDVQNTRKVPSDRIVERFVPVTHEYHYLNSEAACGVSIVNSSVGASAVSTNYVGASSVERQVTSPSGVTAYSGSPSYGSVTTYACAPACGRQVTTTSGGAVTHGGAAGYGQQVVTSPSRVTTYGGAAGYGQQVTTSPNSVTTYAGDPAYNRQVATTTRSSSHPAQTTTYVGRGGYVQSPAP